MTTQTKPTARDVRQSYKDRGCEVRISRDGRVEYRNAGETMWREGRWVSEYRFFEGSVALA